MRDRIKKESEFADYVKQSAPPLVDLIYPPLCVEILTPNGMIKRYYNNESELPAIEEEIKNRYAAPAVTKKNKKGATK